MGQQRENDALREEIGKLRAESDQLQLERAEAAEAAGKLLDEMNELLTEVVHKFQGPPRPSPFAREVKSIAQLPAGHMAPEASSAAARQSEIVRPVDS